MIRITVTVEVDGATYQREFSEPTGYGANGITQKAIGLLEREVAKVKDAMKGNIPSE